MLTVSSFALFAFFDLSVSMFCLCVLPLWANCFDFCVGGLLVTG